MVCLWIKDGSRTLERLDGLAWPTPHGRLLGVPSSSSRGEAEAAAHVRDEVLWCFVGGHEEQAAIRARAALGAWRHGERVTAHARGIRVIGCRACRSGLRVVFSVRD